jgi:hypothetical protein
MKILYICCLLLISNIQAKELDARTWAQYKMNTELLANEKERLAIIEKYRDIFKFFDEREAKIKSWNDLTE